MDLSAVASVFGIAMALLGLAFHAGIMQNKVGRLERDLRDLTDYCHGQRHDWAHEIQELKLTLVKHLPSDKWPK